MVREKFYQEKGCASAPGPSFAGIGGARMAETKGERRRI